MVKSHRIAAVIAVLFSLFLLACDPNDVVADHFASLGLNQLAIPSTGIEPGAVFLSYNDRPAYIDNMLDYAQKVEGIAVSVSVDSLPDEDAVIASMKQSTKVKPSLALGFLKNILPVSGSLAIEEDVSISPIVAKYKAIKATSVASHLASPESEPFRKKLDLLYQTLEDSPDLFIAFEAYRAKRLSITAGEGLNVSAGLMEGDVNQGSGFKYEKTSINVLEFDGDLSYTFAVRAARIEPRGNTQPRQYVVVDAEFTIVDDRIVVSEERAEEIRYSASVVGEDFEPLELVTLSAFGL